MPEHIEARIYSARRGADHRNIDAMPIASWEAHQKRETPGELQFLTPVLPFGNLHGRDVRLIFHPKSRQQEARNAFTKTDSPISGIDGCANLTRRTEIQTQRLYLSVQSGISKALHRMAAKGR